MKKKIKAKLFKLLERSHHRDEKKQQDVESNLREQALYYVTFYPESAEKLMQENIEENNQESKKLLQYLFTAGVNCESIVLDENRIRNLSPETLDSIINNGATYFITEVNNRYLTPVAFWCCCLASPDPIPYLWSSMLIASLENDLAKTRVFVKHYPQFIDLTVKTLDQFYTHLKEGVVWRDGCACCANSKSLFTSTMTCCIYINNIYFSEEVPCNPATREKYQMMDIAFAKYCLMSSVKHWKYSKNDKEQIKYILDSKLGQVKNRFDCERLYKELIENDWFKCVSKPNKPIKNFCVSLFKPLTYPSLKRYAIEALQNKVLNFLDDEKVMMPKKLLNLYNTILATPLFDSSHLAGGVSLRYRNILLHRISDLNNFLEKGQRLF